MSKSKEFVKKALDSLDYYVYIYSDPDTKKPFYIGKGRGNRCFAHLSYTNDCDKVAKIQEILARGKEPIIEILVHGIDENTALKVEAAAIDLIGIENLTNIQKGHHSSVYGRIDVDDINRRYDQQILLESEIDESIIMIRINKAYHYGMTDFEIYDSTRGMWRVNIEQAKKAKYAFSVYDGMILEVYEIVEWFPCGSTMRYYDRPEDQREKVEGRYEFVGRVASQNIRQKYVGKIVSGFFSSGAQNPIKYIFK